MAYADNTTPAPVYQVEIDALRRTVETLAQSMKPKARERALERLQYEADRYSAGNVVPIRGAIWKGTGDRQAYGESLSRIIEVLR